MRFSPRDNTSSFRARLPRVLMVALPLFACRDDVVPEMPPPTDAELAELYGQLCSRSVECRGDPLGYGTVDACTDAQIEYYTQFPDACLNAVVVYHECFVDVPTCGEFTRVNGPIECRDLRSATYDVCDGGVNL